MSDSSLIQLYLNDANEAIKAIGDNLNLIEKFSLKKSAKMGEWEDDQNKLQIEIDNCEKECIKNTRNLSMICWMAGKDEKNPKNDFLTLLLDNHDPFFTKIVNYITRTTATGKIVVEFLKLFEIMMRDNLPVLRRFVGKERNLKEKLQNLLNQTIHPNEDQMIKRWILKIYYLITIYQNYNLKTTYDSLLADYTKDLDDKKCPEDVENSNF